MINEQLIPHDRCEQHGYGRAAPPYDGLCVVGAGERQSFTKDPEFVQCRLVEGFWVSADSVDVGELQ